MKKLFGVITAMTTPFDDKERVDLSALEIQTEFLIEKGVDCLYPCGTTGEMYLCSPDEREVIAETIVKKAAGRVTIYIHTGAMRLNETIRLTQHAHRIGADGAGIVTPPYFTLNERAMIQYYKDVCGSIPQDFPIYLYVIPQLAHNDILPETMEKICEECPNIIGVKYSYPDMNRLLQYLRIKGGNFSVVFGADHLFLPALTVGASGTVSGCSGPFPEAFVNVYKNFKSGNMEAAEKAQVTATNLAWLMKCGSDMSILKNILTFRGVPGGHMRKPLLDISESDREQLFDSVRQYL